jgi:hypothetical protein
MFDMALRIREFNTLKDMELFLRGGVRGGKQLAGLVQNLHGKTLIFLQPSAAIVTFDETAGAAGFGGGLTVQEIRNQIVAAVPAVVPFYADRVLNLVEGSPSSGVSIDKDGTANPLLGFGSGADVVGVVIAAPGGVAPYLVETNKKANNDGYYVVISEA